MKGYFGQLARRTGLSFRNQSAVGGHVASQPAVSSGPKKGAAPIEVEEVVFTSAPAAATSDVSTREISGASKIAGSENQAASLFTPHETFAAPHERVSTFRDASPITESQQQTASIPNTALSQPSAPDESRIQFVASEPQTPKSPTEQVFFSEHPIDSSPRQLIAEPQAVRRIESHVELRQQPANDTPDSSVDLQEVRNVRVIKPAEPTAPKPANVKDEKPLQQDRRQIFQNQLKEVMAWINSPPDEVEQSPETFEVTEIQQTSNAFASEREQGRSPERSITPSEPQVQDLSLSIGTISIVVEEPKQDHPVSLTPPPATHTSPQPVAPEPTRLSRYYLRNL